MSGKVRVNMSKQEATDFQANTPAIFGFLGSHSQTYFSSKMTYEDRILVLKYK